MGRLDRVIAWAALVTTVAAVTLTVAELVLLVIWLLG